MPKFFIKLENLAFEDSAEVGSDVANLSNFSNVGGQLPKGFVVTYSTHKRILEKSLREITNLLGAKSLKTFTDQDIASLRKKLSSVNLTEIETELNLQLKNLSTPLNIKAFALLPSNNQIVSFETLINQKSTFNIVFYEAAHSFLSHKVLNNLKAKEDLAKVQISILVTEKENSEISGRAIVNQDLINIYSQWGEFNEHEKFDEIELSLKTLELQRYTLNAQTKQLLIEKGKYKTIPVSKKYQRERKLEPSYYNEIARILKKLKVRFLESVGVYFEVSEDKLIFTGINLNSSDSETSFQNAHFPIALPLLSNLTPLIPGIVSGIARTIGKNADLGKLRAGDIAIIDSFKKAYLPGLKKASGIVINSAANFQKEHLAKLRDIGLTSALGKLTVSAGQVITLDGKTGRVYRGAFSPFLNKTIMPMVKEVMEVINPKSATKIFVYGNDTLSPKELGWSNIDGIGPINPESFLIKSGIHPKHLLTGAQEKTLTERLQTLLEELSQKLQGNPLIYQLSDFKTDQLINLTAGRDHEVEERNPIIGKRGAQRSLENPELVKLELALIKELRNKENLRNIWLSLPFVRTLSELYAIKRLISAQGLDRSTTFKLLLTTNVPANILLLEEAVSMGIDGIVIDYYDLACLTFGKNFTYEELVALEDPAVEELIEIALVTARKKKIFSLIVGAPLESENEIIKKCISWGVTAVSVKSDQVGQVKKLLAQEEKDLVLSRND